MSQSSLLEKDFKSSQGYKEHVRSFYDAGNLDFLKQRIDIGIIEGDKDLLPKFKSKIGKVLINGKEFINHKNKDGSLEVPQEFRTAFPDRVRDLWIETLRAEIRLRKLRGQYDTEYRKYMINQCYSEIMDIFREEK